MGCCYMSQTYPLVDWPRQAIHSHHCVEIVGLAVFVDTLMLTLILLGFIDRTR